MTVKIEVSEQEKKELVDFFNAKKERLKRELEATESTLAKLANGHSSSETDTALWSPHQPITVGWKYKIDEVLKDAKEPLTALQVLDAIIIDDPEIGGKRESARKSIASALSVNSKDENDRYIRILRKGLSYYSLNKNFNDIEE